MASLPDLPLDAVTAIVDAGSLDASDIAALACTCRSLAETARAVAPSHLRLRATPEAAAWASTRLAAVTRLWVDVPPSSDAGAAVLAAALSRGAAPRLAALDVAVPHRPDADALPELALAAWLGAGGAPRLRHLGVHGARPSVEGLAARALEGLLSLALDSEHTSPLWTPCLCDTDVTALDLPSRTPRLESLAMREGLVRVAGPMPYGEPNLRGRLPPSLTHVSLRGSGLIRPWSLSISTVEQLLAELPALGQLSLCNLSAGPLGAGTAAALCGTHLPLGCSVQLALATTHARERDGPLAMSLGLLWVAPLTALTLAPAPTVEGYHLSDLEHPLARLVSLTLTEPGDVRGPVPAALAAGLTSLTLRAPRRRSHVGFRLAWPTGGWPALRSFSVCVGQGEFVVCADGGSADGSDGDRDDNHAKASHEWPSPLSPPLPPAAAAAAGAALGARLRHLTFVAGGAAARWNPFQAAVLSALRPPLVLDSTVDRPAPAALGSPESAPPDGVTWPVSVAATHTGRALREGLASVAEGLPSHLRAGLFGRDGSRGVQAAVAALGRIPLSPDEVAAM